VSSQIPSLSLANVGDTFAVRDILFPLTSAGRGRAREASNCTPSERPRAVQPLVRPGQPGDLEARGTPAWTACCATGSFDYPVVANLVGGYGSIRDGRCRCAARISRAGPYTPFDEARSTTQRRAVYDLSRVNGERAPAYFRADLRVDRTFIVNGQPVAVFAGAQNITNRKNFASYTWDRRNGVVRVNEQLGLFPILGVDWRF
jgi:hypothetical protein